MLNARDLLGQLMQAGMADSSSDRLRHAMGSEGLGRQDNPLGQLLQGLGGGTGSGGLGSLAEMAQGMFGQAKGSVQSGNPLAIGGLAALAGALLGGGRRRNKGRDRRRRARPARHARHAGAAQPAAAIDADRCEQPGPRSSSRPAGAAERERGTGARATRAAHRARDDQCGQGRWSDRRPGGRAHLGQARGGRLGPGSTRLSGAGTAEADRQRRHHAPGHRARSSRSRSMPRRCSRSRSTPRPSELICATSPRAWAWMPAP